MPDWVLMVRFFFSLVLTLAAMSFAGVARAAAPANGIEGRWAVEETDPNAAVTEGTLTFRRNGVAVTGTLLMGGELLPLFDIREAGARVSFTVVISSTPYADIRFTGTRKGTTMTLTASTEGNRIYRLVAQRGGRPATTVTAQAPQAPSPPAKPVNAPPAPAASVPPAPQIRTAEKTPDPVASLIAQTDPGQTTGAIPPPRSRNTGAPPQRSAAAAPPKIPGTPATTRTTASATRFEGDWTAELTFPSTSEKNMAQLHIIRRNNVLSGTMRFGNDELRLYEMKQMGASVSFSVVIPGTPYVTVHYAGTMANGSLGLASADSTNGKYTLSARRSGVNDTAGPAAADQAPAPEPPPLATPTPEPPPPVAAAASKSEPAPPEAPAAVEHERYTPPPLSKTPAVKIALPPLRDVAPSGNLKTPPMGWASRQRLGTMIDDETIRQAADGLDETGLKAAGYTYLEVDDGWQGERDADGALHANPGFPDMKSLGDYIHGKGLKFGLMSSANPQSCAGYTGSYGHEENDAKIFAGWGVDVLVYDWCGAEKIFSTQPEMQAAYQKMGSALRASGRDIALEIAADGQFDVASWGARTGAVLWRTGKDVEDKFPSAMDAGFAVAGATSGDGPPHWNDPGLLQAGNGGMSSDEYRTQLNLWTVLGAPLVLGNDVRIMRRETVDLLTNKEMLAVHQDSAGKQGIRISQTGNTGIWAKPLTNGAVAVLFVNRGPASAPAALSWEQLGITGPHQIRDVWWHQNIGMANGGYSVFLTSHTSVLLVLSPDQRGR